MGKISDRSARFLLEDPSMNGLRLFVPLEALKDLLNDWLKENAPFKLGPKDVWILDPKGRRGEAPGIVIIRQPEARA